MPLRVLSPARSSIHCFTIARRNRSLASELDRPLDSEHLTDLRAQIQTTIGDTYMIERELGGGGMSRVFLAEERALGRRVVVKVLPQELSGGVSSERFRREISLAARLQHPHIVPLLTAGDMNGLPYFTMPFVEGESLRARLARHGEFPVSEAMRLLREVASALQYAHERGVVHRDIKPDNVLLSAGSAMVTDFGVAKALAASTNNDHGAVTSLGVALGTPAYMSPEQASADPSIDHRADIYAFGAMAYELLSGQPPFAGRTPQALLAAHVSQLPEPILKLRASIPPGLAALVMRCLEKRPSDRPQSAAEIVHMLDDITTPSGGMQPTSALPATSASSTSASNTHQGRWQIMAAIAGAATVIAVGWYAVSHRGGPSSGSDAPTSVGVLPLVDVTGDTADRYFVDGMTDEITSALTRVPGLRIASRSAAAMIDTHKEIRYDDVAHRLNVAALLEGRLRRQGSRLRLTMQLTNGADGLSLWSQSFDAEIKDAFKVQDEVARSIAGALRLALSDGALAEHSRTNSPEAHDLLLRARYQSNLYNDASLRRAVALYEQAIAVDSGYVDAWAGLGDTWTRLADDYVAANEAIPHARQALARAIALDSTNILALSLQASIYEWNDQRFSDADRLFTRVLRADSTSDLGTVWYPFLLLERNLRDSAAALVDRKRRNDPTSRLLLRSGTHVALRAGHPDLAREICQRAVETDSVAFGYCRGDILYAEGKFEEALSYYRGRSHRWTAILLGRLGRSEEARRAAELEEAQHRGRYTRPGPMAEMWARVGDTDRAMAWLEREERNGGAGMMGLANNPEFESLRRDPRFVAMVKRVAPH